MRAALTAMSSASFVELGIANENARSPNAKTADHLRTVKVLTESSWSQLGMKVRRERMYR